MRNTTLATTFLLIACLSATMWQFLGAGVVPALGQEAQPAAQPEGYIGSGGCRECHEKFYKLWAPSHHGLAMQPYTDELAEKELTPQQKDVVIGHYRYRAEVEAGKGWVRERGPQGESKYPMKYAMGGKNVYYFLTPMERGRLQTLPVSYDVRRKDWFDVAASGLRHISDEPVHWKDSAYRFNTACHSCHVSQLSTNYDLETDTYDTTWTEPGINCETCHGPGEEHVRVCREAPEGQIPKDLKIVRGGRDFTTEQNNETCAPCHAKMVPLTTTFMPGDRFFDHYDLVTLEHQDFYADGRDLGENYTYTLWLMSPCARSGQLSCLHCHTSSGRFRQKDDPNSACLPCHEERIKNAVDHTHHPADSEGNKCISCHMPMTEFARMRRSDHSMLPPTPAATVGFESPNACNLCHTDKDAAWADQWVRKWHTRDYQAAVLQRAGLIEAARRRDWSRLGEMLDYITGKDSDEVVATSLIRLLGACTDERKWSAVHKALEDLSPLVRSAAAAALVLNPRPKTRDALLKATQDDRRLVRIQAAVALSGYPKMLFSDEDRKKRQLASGEYVASLLARPDHWASHYNLGNYYFDGGDPSLALGAFEMAMRLEPRSILPMVNAAMVYARFGEPARAEELLNKALQIDPGNAVANFNMGLLKAEHGEAAKAEKCLRAALKADPKMHEAAYNLAVLVADKNMQAATKLLVQAYEENANPKYAYTLAFYLRQQGNADRTVEVLQSIIRQWPEYTDAYMLLADVYMEQGKPEEAQALYNRARAILRQSGQQ